MELIHTKSKTGGKHKILYIRVTSNEALKIITSLSEQMLSGSPNVGRWETFAKDGTDVSIGVVPAHPLACWKCGHSLAAHGTRGRCTECLCRSFE